MRQPLAAVRRADPIASQTLPFRSRPRQAWRIVVDLPSGTVTFLFTDIEGSTAFWESNPQAMAAALESHDAILRGAVEDHDGYVFSTGGDGRGAAFGRAAGGVDAALEAQKALTSFAWPAPVVIRVRMGLHTGEVTERAGDYFGPP
jgi:class 3 adenylate cyclase